jgi:hypothetical protein
MSQIPFDPYDFFGYLAAGLLVVVGMDLTLGFPRILGQDLKVVDVAVLLLGVYVAGQLTATPARAVIEDGIVGKVLGRPSVNLLRAERPLIRGFVFPGFFKPLPEPIRLRILAKARADGMEHDGEALFLHVRYLPEILGNEKLMARLAGFLNKYGFARNLAFTSLLVAIALLIKGRLEGDQRLLDYAYLGFVAAVLLFYRYLKFFRQYSYELFNTYGGMKHSSPPTQAPLPPMQP